MNLVQAVQAANPGLRHGDPGMTGAGVQMGSAVRTVGAGGFLPDLLLHPVFVPFQYIYRMIPNEGLYSASRTRNYTFECGAFTVPQSQVLVIAQYNFTPYRQSGIATDAVPLEPGRLPLQLGYDLNFSQWRKGQLRAEIIPRPPSNAQSAFQGNVTQGGLAASDVLQEVLQSVYDEDPVGTEESTPSAFVAVSAPGSALLPQSDKGVQGPERFPFSFVVEESQAVQLKITAFGPVPIPISFFETLIAGYLMPRTAYAEMLKGIRP